jgi:hypothetical protein
MEFTVGHHPESVKKNSDGAAAGKDVPKNKLMNYLALRSFGFRHVQAHYVTMTGEPDIKGATRRTLTTTDGFAYVCITDLCGVNIEVAVLQHYQDPSPMGMVRSWHNHLIQVVESAATDFHMKTC